MEEPIRIKGKITAIKDPGGYFFIASPAMPYTKIFAHWSTLPNTVNFLDLSKGMELSFEVERYTDRDGKDKGWRAKNIQIEIVESESKGIPEAKVERIR